VSIFVHALRKAIISRGVPEAEKASQKLNQVFLETIKRNETCHVISIIFSKKYILELFRVSNQYLMLLFYILISCLRIGNNFLIQYQFENISLSQFYV